VNEPGRACALCPRLVAYRADLQGREPGWHNAPVPAFGPIGARLLIVGLAPGAAGANRTGRPFTGDWAGDLLYATLPKFGFARGTYDGRADDDLKLIDARITNAVRCVPPQNKPVGAEIRTCRSFLLAEIEAMPSLQAILALGRISHDSLCAALGKRLPFAHGARHEVRPGLTLFDSYHCSRYNTNTGVLTTAMFEAVFAAVRDHLGPSRDPAS
jgi:uracil-DNA glycosylase family 4